MADITQNIKLTGFLKSDTATITVTLDGAQVFSGAVLNPGSEFVEGTLANFHGISIWIKSKNGDHFSVDWV